MALKKGAGRDAQAEAELAKYMGMKTGKLDTAMIREMY